MSDDQLAPRTREVREQNREFIRTGYEAFARGDIPVILSMLDPKVEWTDAEGFPTAGTYVGPEAVRGMFAHVGADWDHFEAVPSTYVADGDHVVVLGEYSVTHKATGKSATVPFAHVWRIKDGKIIRFRQFTDGPSFQRVVK
jgi:ketosteroid isomerase-like protein